MEVVIESPLGNIRLIEKDDHLVELVFTEDPLTTAPENDLLKDAISQIDEYFSSKRQEFDLPIEPVGTEFQLKVWHELINIPYSTTISYQEVANRLGDPKSIRAGASANGKNPIAIIIPCHRVIGSHGEMTGYAGGIQRKKDLLSLEGADVMNQMNIF
jgi:methylated-DNA-[protein]-cysteine S-methyltransferase